MRPYQTSSVRQVAPPKVTVSMSFIARLSLLTPNKWDDVKVFVEDTPRRRGSRHQKSGVGIIYTPIYIYIYVYRCVYVCMCIYIYIYMLLVQFLLCYVDLLIDALTLYPVHNSMSSRRRAREDAVFVGTFAFTGWSFIGNTFSIFLPQHII